jgi:hypothetical protein
MGLGFRVTRQEIKELRVAGFLFIYKLENHLGWASKKLFFKGVDKECVFSLFFKVSICKVL